MERRLLSILLVLTLAAIAIAGPAEAEAAALRDLVRRPSGDQRHMRYMVVPKEEAVDWRKVLDFWANSLSKKSQRFRLYRVGADLVALDLRRAGIDPKVWDRLADFEPYHYIQGRLVDVSEVIDWKGGVHPSDGKVWPAGRYKVWSKKRENVSVLSYGDEKVTAALTLLTGSKAPIVRGDWWLVHTSQQVGRKGTGYRDFLGTPNRAAFQRRVGLDQKLAEELERVTRSILARSGVAINNRQIVRFQTITGGYWATLDVNNSLGKRNAVRNLGSDYVHDAEEIYGVLPNGLLAMHLSDAAGTAQDSVPDTIAHDRTSPNNDKRVHLASSCVRCHIEGIRPIEDWARKAYRLPDDTKSLKVLLADPDYDRLERNQREYLSGLGEHVKDDQERYEKAVKDLTGLKAPEMARLFKRLHSEYLDADLLLADVARLAGYTEEQVRAALLTEARTNPPLDPPLAGLLAKPDPLGIRRESVEELFPTIMQLLRRHTKK
jgi:hypothetical protein